MVDIENTRNFCFLVEMCGGVMEAYDVCERFGGIKIVIPKKEHKRVIAKAMLEKGVSYREIARHLGISKGNLLKIKRKLKGGSNA